MTGTITVQKASFNFSGSRFSPVMSHVNGSVDHVERPLMTPDEVMRLRLPQKSGSGSSETITAPGHMLIFVSGHFPILGMQMLYFFDPELKRRAAVPPPTALPSLEGTAITQQKPVDRMANLPSKAEAVLPEEATSHLERGFLEELHAAGDGPVKEVNRHAEKQNRTRRIFD